MLKNNPLAIGGLNENRALKARFLVCCETTKLRGLQLLPVALEMLISGAQTQFEGKQALEVVTDIELIGHAHAAVQLHSLLADIASRLPHQRLGRR